MENPIVRTGLILFAVVYLVMFIINQRKRNEVALRNFGDKVVGFLQGLAYRGLPILAGVILAMQGKVAGEDFFAQFSFLAGVFLNFSLASVWSQNGSYLVIARKEVIEQDAESPVLKEIDYYGKVMIGCGLAHMVFVAIFGGGPTGVGLFLAGMLVGYILPHTDTTGIREKALVDIRKIVRDAELSRARTEAEIAAKKERTETV